MDYPALLMVCMPFLKSRAVTIAISASIIR
jgi:hypothetical protein